MTSFYTSSPTVVIPQQPLPDQYFHAGHYRTFQPIGQSNGLFNQSAGPSTSSSIPTPSSGSIVGRKRSRGVIEDDNYEPLSPVAPVELPPAPKVEPTYGPGMTLSYPSDPRGHYVSAADSEERAKAAAMQSDRPVMPSRKSQRTTAHVSEDHSLQTQPDQVTQALDGKPLIDQATRLLGISWMRMDRYEGGRINQRAYTRWIERHFPSLTKVELWFENNSIPGYLGTAFNKTSNVQEYLLWSMDLKQAVLITRQSSELIPLLSTAQPANLIKSATMSIFANEQPTFENGNNSSAAETQTPTLQVAGDMDVDS